MKISIASKSYDLALDFKNSLQEFSCKPNYAWLDPRIQLHLTAPPDLVIILNQKDLNQDQYYNIQLNIKRHWEPEPQQIFMEYNFDTNNSKG